MQLFGQYLRSEREKRGVRLEEIASSTKIQIQNLNLMEADRWAELPRNPFIRGFISAYARYLGLDEKETLHLFNLSQTPPETIAEENLEASSSRPVSTPTTPPPRPLRSESLTPPQPIEIKKRLRNKNTPGESVPLSPQLKKALGLGALFAVGSFIVWSVGNSLSGESKTPGSQTSTEISQPSATLAIAPTGNPNGNSASLAAASSKETAPNSNPNANQASDQKSPQEANANGPAEPSKATPTKERSSEPEQTSALQPASPEPSPKVASQSVVTPTPNPPPAAQPKSEAAPPNPPAPALPAAQSDLNVGSPQLSGELSSSGSHELSVQPKYRTWYKIIIDDKPAKESFLDPGEKLTFNAQEKIRLVLGNSAGAEIFHNGEKSEGKKLSGTIRFYHFPEKARFPQDKPKLLNTKKD